MLNRLLIFIGSLSRVLVKKFTKWWDIIYLEIINGFVTCKVKKVNGSRPRHEICRECKHKDPKKCQHCGKIIACSAVPNKSPQLRPAEAAYLRAENQHQKWYGGQINPMIYQIMVTQFHILEVNRLHKVWQATTNPDGEC